MGSTRAPMKRAFADLFALCIRSGTIRADLSSGQLLSIVSALPKDAVSGQTPGSSLELVIDGLRSIVTG